jgi:hypothetical protein
MHSISQETLIGIDLVRGGLLDYRKMRRLGDKFFAGSLYSGKKLLVRRSDFDAWLENRRFRPIESINVAGIVNELLSELVETE